MLDKHSSVVSPNNMSQAMPASKLSQCLLHADPVAPTYRIDLNARGGIS